MPNGRNVLVVEDFEAGGLLAEIVARNCGPENDNGGKGLFRGRPN